MIQFLETNPDRLEPEALIHLNNAIIKGQSNLTLNEVLESARNKEGTIYTIQDDKIIGAMYLERFPMTVNIVLLGGFNIRLWKSELVAFIRSVLKSEGVEYCCLLGRSGWHGLFEELEYCGSLYRGK